MTLPLVVLFVILGARLRSAPPSIRSGAPPPALNLAPPKDAGRYAGDCTKLLEALPVGMAGLTPRRVRSASPFVLAWGEPAVILRCGVRKPAALFSGSAAELRVINDVPFALTQSGGSSVFTVVDRRPYISVTFEPGRQPADYLSVVTSAVTRSLPAVCTTDPAAPTSQQCAER